MIDQYATGKKVYNGGLPNAQSGTLDPTGYINRESQRRSGLAAVAMKRRSGGGQKPSSPTKKALNAHGIYINPLGKLGWLK
jgi:hypothetical protein